MALDETMQLFHATMDGRANAKDLLLERLRPRLVLWAAARLYQLRDKLEPEDVAQDVLLRVNGALDQFDGTDFVKFRAWFFTVARNTVRDLARFHGAKKRQQPEPRYRTWTSPSEGAMRKEDLDRMKQAIRQLRPVDQEVIRLRCLEELPHAEVAERMGRSSTAVRILLCRALKHLRELLDAAEGHIARDAAPAKGEVS